MLPEASGGMDTKFSGRGTRLLLRNSLRDEVFLRYPPGNSIEIPDLFPGIRVETLSSRKKVTRWPVPELENLKLANIPQVYV
jgi:hypothetical protein